MSLFLIPREIAKAAATLDLRSLPHTARGIQHLAKREGWAAHSTLVRPRNGRPRGENGGIEYHISLLPPYAREQIGFYFGCPVPLRARLKFLFTGKL